MHVFINSVTASKFKLGWFKVLYSEVIAFEFTYLVTVDDVVILNKIDVAKSILEEDGI